MKRKLLLSLMFFLSLFLASKANAQTCSGSQSCCVSSTYTCPSGCTNVTCPGQCTEVCSLQSGFNCVMTAGSPANCINPSTTCKSNFPITGACYVTETCPSGQIFCGGCIGDCRANSKSCGTYGQLGTWIGDECPPGGSGGQPTNPPGCTARCTAPLCGQDNGCGGFCATTDGVRFLTTPVIVAPVEGSVVTTPTVLVNWGNVTNADEYRIQIEEVIFGVNKMVVDQVWSATISNASQYTFNPGAIATYYSGGATGYANGGFYGRTFRARVKARQNLCKNSEWSQWDKFSMSATAASCTITAVPAAPGVTAGGATTVTGSVVATGGTVTQVTFASSDTRIATLSKASDTTSPYNTVMTGVAGGTANITLTATVVNAANVTATCSVVAPATVGQLTGQMCKDDRVAYSSTGSACNVLPVGCTPYVPNTNEQVVVSNGATRYPTVAVANDGTFSVNVPPAANYQVQLTSDDFLNTCVCPGSCRFTGVTSPTNTIRYYYRPRQVRDAWWQTINGFVYAGNTSGASVYSQIPEDTCITVPEYTCKPYLSLRDDADTTDSSGGVMTGGGSIDVSVSSGSQTDNIDEDGNNMRATGTSVNRVIENWDYFYRLYGFNNPNNDISNPSSKPTGTPVNGAAYYRNGNLDINAAWTVNSNESKVIFVNGNLTINNTISVANGGFLAFIVKGNISVANTVCQNSFLTNDGVVEGVYIANGTLSIASKGAGDCKFVGEGIFAGLTGVSLNRDFQNNTTQVGYNAVAPVEVFKYRPDFVINTPIEMKRALYQWQEVGS